MYYHVLTEQGLNVMDIHYSKQFTREERYRSLEH